jgi:hypothetical protein
MHSCCGGDHTSAMISSQKQNLITPGPHLQRTDEHMMRLHTSTSQIGTSFQQELATFPGSPTTSHSASVPIPTVLRPWDQLSLCARNLPGGKGDRHIRLTTLPPPVYRMWGPYISKHHGPPLLVMATALTFHSWKQVLTALAVSRSKRFPLH